MDPLSLDILAETARGFFGARVQLDRKISLFDDFVEALAQKARAIDEIAAHLNYLLISPRHASAFYAAIGIQNAPFSSLPGQYLSSAFEKTGFALTAKGQYHKLLRQAYGQLELNCRDYLYGEEPQDSETDEMPVYLGMVVKMAEVINSEINALNRNRPPSDTMQFVGRLNTERQAKTSATGTSSQYADMDKKLGYALIDIKALKIAQYPELPPFQAAEPHIRKFSNRMSAAHKKEVKELLAEVRALSQR